MAASFVVVTLPAVFRVGAAFKPAFSVEEFGVCGPFMAVVVAPGRVCVARAPFSVM